MKHSLTLCEIHTHTHTHTHTNIKENENKHEKPFDVSLLKFGMSPFDKSLFTDTELNTCEPDLFLMMKKIIVSFEKDFGLMVIKYRILEHFSIYD